MDFTKEDAVREERIEMEIVVDAYDKEERAMGWFYYLENVLTFPFQATCIGKRQISPLRVGQTVTVTGMPDEEECQKEVLVLVDWESKPLAVPLGQLLPLDVDDDTAEAVADWHYWVAQGYRY
jgi:hypothetical protein